MRKIYVLCVFIFIQTLLWAQPKTDTRWFEQARFGIFIHWGLYSQIGYTEWCQNHFEFEAADYEKLKNSFNPVNFNSEVWAKLIKESGAKYVVMTSKHHEGFCMYPSAFTDYDIENTLYKKDIIGQLKASLDKQKIPFGLYYSVMDWHHPDYLPRRYFEKRTGSGADLKNYKLYFKNQVSEIIRKYKPVVLWFDGEWENTHDSLETVELVQMMHQLKPDILFNNRLSRWGYGDFRTPENTVPATGIKDENGKPVVWETCHTINDSWGYDPFSREFMSSRDLIRILIDIASKGGNLLLNIGPKPDGSIQPEFISRLQDLGKWLNVNGESIYGTQASIFPSLPFYGRSTTGNNKVYLHLFMKPENGILEVPMLKNKILAIKTLSNHRDLTYTLKGNQIKIDLKNVITDIDATVIVIETEDTPKIDNRLPIVESASEIILTPEKAEMLPLGKQSLELRQYFDKMRIYKWNFDNQNAYLDWNFETLNNSKLNICLHAASTKETTDSIPVKLIVDNDTIPGFLPGRRPWSFMNEYIYNGVKLGTLQLNAGRHHIRLIILAPAFREAVFEKLRFFEQR